MLIFVSVFIVISGIFRLLSMVVDNLNVRKFLYFAQFVAEDADRHIVAASGYIPVSI